jgi:hypothetical protein
MTKRCFLNLAVSLAVLFLASTIFGQEAETKAARITACEADTCVSKVMSLPNFSAPSELQDVVNTIRQILNIYRITSNTSEHSISLQGTREQIGVAERIVSVLENLKLSVAKNRASVLVYQPDPSVPGPKVSETVSDQSGVAAHRTHCELSTCFIEALYLPDYSIMQLQEVVNRLRSNANVVRINIVPSSHAIVLQGTSEQLAVAEKLMKE